MQPFGTAIVKAIRLIAMGLALAAGAIAHTACDYIDAVQTVKDSTLDDHPGATVGEVIAKWMSNAKWEVVGSEHGQIYVNVRGVITYKGKPATAGVQYRVVGATNRIECNAFEIDGAPESVLAYANLISVPAWELELQKQRN